MSPPSPNQYGCGMCTISGIGQFIAAVTDGHAPEAGHAVEDLVAFAVPEVNAFGIGDDPRALLFQLFEVAEGGQVVIIAQDLPFTGLRVLAGHTNLPSSG